MFDSQQRFRSSEDTSAAFYFKEKTEIPTRNESKFYKDKPQLQARLERACTNEKVILLSKLLQNQQSL
jgi:hypothetical protein